MLQRTEPLLCGARVGGQLAESCGNPPTDRVVAAGQVPGVVSVEAFDAAPRSADTATRTGTRVGGGYCSIALGGVAVVRVGNCIETDTPLGLGHPAGALEPADPDALLITDEPIPRGHGPAVVEERGVADHHRSTIGVPDHDDERPLRRTTEQSADQVRVVGGN